MKDEQVSCTECGALFDFHIEHEQLKSGAQVLFFRCTECGHRYDSCRISGAGIRIQAKMERSRKALSEAFAQRDSERVAKIQRNIQEYKDELAKHVTNLASK